jgi:hypothetical protein
MAFICTSFLRVFSRPVPSKALESTFCVATMTRMITPGAPAHVGGHSHGVLRHVAADKEPSEEERGGDDAAGMQPSERSHDDAGNP